jgi:dolichol-phosphate mannosyltransferase
VGGGRSALERLMGETRTKGYSFQMEILVRAQRGGLKVEELPIVFVDRLFGQSKLEANEIFLYAKGLIQLFFED